MTGSTYQRGGKRVVDAAVAAMALVVVSPLLAVISVLSRLVQGTPVLFRQTRAGRQGRPFDLWKFRTMRSVDQGASDDERLTAWGRLLRHASLDELPQLVNVLKGDMSLVGPRPLYLHYVPLYSAEQAERLAVRPGLTGLAQVSGRNQLGWDQRLRLDTRYARAVSLRLDIAIVARTVVQLARRASTAAGGTETPLEFAGTSLAVKAQKDNR